jgi:hypothetical protein
VRSARDNHNNTTQPAREIAGSLGWMQMQTPRRVSVDVSAAARFALLFFPPSSRSISAHVRTAAAGLRPRRIRLSAADPPGYQTPAQKKVRLSPSQLAAVPARPLAGGFFFFAPWNNQRGRAVCLVFTAAVQNPGAVPVLVHYQYQARRIRVIFSTGILCVYAISPVEMWLWPCSYAECDDVLPTPKKKVHTSRNTVVRI